jgi:hypothetical protein
MLLRLVILFVSAAFSVSCANAPFFGSLSPEAAVREAHRDIASGHMKLYRAGTRASYEVGVEQSDLALVASLPRDNRLSRGCMDSLASEHAEYARAYNTEIVHYCRAHPKI